MKKENIIKKNYQYTRIFEQIKPQRSKNFLFYLEKTDKKDFSFGFAVSSKKTTAVTRNFIKRRMKSIVRKYNFKEGFNCIILAKKEVAEVEFNLIEKELELFFRKNNLLEEGEK